MTPDYLGNVYKTLSESIDGFKKTEQEFRTSMQDSLYADKVYKTLQENIDGFAKTQDEFFTASGLKKKPTPSVSSSGSLPVQNTTEVKPPKPTAVNNKPFKVLHADNTYVVDPVKERAFDAKGNIVPDDVYDVIIKDKNKGVWTDMMQTTDQKVADNLVAKKMVQATKDHKAKISTGINKAQESSNWQSDLANASTYGVSNAIKVHDELKKEQYSPFQAQSDVVQDLLPAISEKQSVKFFEQPEVKKRVEQINKEAEQLPEEERQTYYQDKLQELTPELETFVNTGTEKEYNRLLGVANDEYLKNTASKSGAEYIVSQGILNSIAGTAINMYTNTEVPDVYDANWVQKGVSGALGIMLDAPLFGMMGQAGKVVATKGLSAVRSTLVKKFVKQGMSDELAAMMADRAMTYSARSILTKPLIQRGIISSASSASALGGYDALNDILAQADEIQKNPDLSLKDFDYLQTLGSFSKGVGLGLGLGVLNTSVSPLYGRLNATLSNPYMRDVAKAGVFTGEFTAENAMFVYGGAALRGNISDVKAEDFLESVAMLGALKIKGGVGKGIEKAATKTKADPNSAAFKEFVKNNSELTEGEYDALRSQGYLKSGAGLKLDAIRKLDGNMVKDMMSNPNVPETVKRKVLYASQGIMIETDSHASKVTVRNENNQFYVDVRDEQGNLITTERHKDARSAQEDAKEREDYLIFRSYANKFSALDAQSRTNITSDPGAVRDAIEAQNRTEEQQTVLDKFYAEIDGIKIEEPKEPKLVSFNFETKRDEVGNIRRNIKAQSDYLNELERVDVATNGYVSNSTLNKMGKIEESIEELKAQEQAIISEIQPVLDEKTQPIQDKIDALKTRINKLDKQLDDSKSDVDMMKVAQEIEPLQDQLEKLYEEKKRREEELIDTELESQIKETNGATNEATNGVEGVKADKPTLSVVEPIKKDGLNVGESVGAKADKAQVLNQQHKELLEQHTNKINELLASGINSKDVLNHPEILQIRNQMADIENRVSNLQAKANDKGESFYHGTNEDFTEFSLDNSRKTDNGWYGKGVYFHTSKDQSAYGKNVKEVKLNLKNPIELPVDNAGKYLYNIIGKAAGLGTEFKNESVNNIIREIGSERFTELAKSLGYDGIIVNYTNGAKEANVFDPKNVKIVNQNINEIRNSQIENIQPKDTQSLINKGFEFEKRTSDALNHFGNAKDEKDSKEASNEINKSEQDRKDWLDTIFKDNKPDEKYDDVHDAVLDGKGEVSSMPEGYTATVIDSYYEPILRRNHTIVEVDNGKSKYYIDVNTYKRRKIGESYGENNVQPKETVDNNKPFDKVSIQRPTKNIELSEDNQADFEYDLMQALGKRIGSSFDYIKKGNAVIRVKGHEPNWDNFNEDVYDNGVTEIVNITVGDFNATNKYSNKSTKEEFAKQFPDIKIIDLKVEKGESVNDVLDYLEREINKFQTVQPKAGQPVQEKQVFSENEQPEEMNTVSERKQKDSKTETEGNVIEINGEKFYEFDSPMTPNGAKAYHNKKSRFGGGYKSIFVKDGKVIENVQQKEPIIENEQAKEVNNGGQEGGQVNTQSGIKEDKPTEVIPEKVQPSDKSGQLGKKIEPNKEVSASKSAAIKDVLTLPEHSKLKEMEATMLVNEVKDKDTGEILSIPDEGLKAQMFKSMEDKGYVTRDIDDNITLTEKGVKFVESVKARQETRKGVKAGTDLFPEYSGIPEVEKIKDGHPETRPETVREFAGKTESESRELEPVIETIERKAEVAESLGKQEIEQAIKEIDEIVAKPRTKSEPKTELIKVNGKEIEVTGLKIDKEDNSITYQYNNGERIALDGEWERVGEKKENILPKSEVAKENGKVMDKTIAESVAEAKKELGKEWRDDYEREIVSEAYSEIEKAVKAGGKISQRVYDSMSPDHQNHFDKHYNNRGDKVISEAKEVKVKSESVIKDGDNYSVHKDDKNISKRDKEYIVVGRFVFESKDLKDGTTYSRLGDRLVENKESNRHSVKGIEYYGNGTVQEAIDLKRKADAIEKPKEPQSQVLDLAFNELGIPINEYKQKIEGVGKVKRMPTYIQEGFEAYKTRVREYLSQIPKLNKAVSDELIKKWFYDQTIIHLKNRAIGDFNHIGTLVHDKNVDNAIESQKNINGRGDEVVSKKPEKVSVSEKVEETDKKDTIADLQEQFGEGKITKAEYDKKVQKIREQGFVQGEAANPVNTVNPLNIPAAPILGGKPQRWTQMLQDLNKKLSKAGLFGRVDYGKGKRGVYLPGSGAIRVKSPGDIPAVTHELGHRVDDKYNVLESVQDGSLDSELSRFWVTGSMPPAGHPNPIKYQRSEGFGEFIRAYMINPAETRKQAPGLYHLYETKVPKEIRKPLEEYSNGVREFFGMSDNQKAEYNKTDHAQEVGFWETALKPFISQGEFKVNWWDKVKQGMGSQYAVIDKAWKHVLEMKGIEDVLPSKDFIKRARLLLGANRKFQAVLENGMINSKGDLLIDSKTGQAKTWDWLIDPYHIGAVNYDQVKSNKDYTENVMMAERALELVNKKEYAQVEADIVDGTMMPPVNVIAKHPKLAAKYKTQIDKFIQDGIDAGWSSADMFYEAERYDFTSNTLTGFGAGMVRDYDIAQGVMKEYENLQITDPDRYDMVKEASRRYREMSTDVLRYMLDSGRLSKDAFDYITEGNQFYVAMKVVKEIDSGIHLEEDGVGKKGEITSIDKSIIKKYEGSAHEKVDPYVGLIETMDRAIKESDRNSALATFVEPLRASRGMNDGEVEYLADIAYQVDAVTGGETITVYTNGKAEHWRLNKDLYDAITTMNDVSVGVLGSYWNPMKILRQSVTTFPVFQARNRVRDFQARLIVGQGGVSYKDFQNRKQAKRDLELSGGGQFGYYFQNKVNYYDFMKKGMEEMASDKNHSILNPAKLGRKIKNGYMETLGQSELQTRAEEYNSVYRKAKKQGMSDFDARVEAAFAARNLMDFGVSGKWMKYINAVFPFTNARLRGFGVAMRALRTNPMGTLGKYTAFTLVPEAIHAMIIADSGDETKEKYLQLPAWKRDMFWNIPAGDGWISIPKPFEFGLLSSLMRRGYDYAAGDKNAYSEDVIRFFRDNLLPINPSMLTGANPASDILYGRDSFRKKDIIPWYEKNLDVSQRSGTDRASRIGKGVQALTGDNIDARTVDHIIKTLFTYPGNWAISLSDIGREDKENKFNWDKTGFYTSDQPFYGNDATWVRDQVKNYGINVIKDVRTANKYKGLEYLKELQEFQDRSSKYWKIENENMKNKEAEALRKEAAILREKYGDKDIAKDIKKYKEIKGKGK